MALRGALRQREQRLDAVRHRHERNARVRPHETRVRLAFRGGVNHLGRVVRRAARRHRHRRDQARKPDGAKVNAAADGIRRQLLVVMRVVVAELLAIQLVAPVHRRRMRELILANPAGRALGVE